MTKFWRMVIASFAMASMVLVPISCGDDEEEDEDNGKETTIPDTPENPSKDELPDYFKSLKGRVFTTNDADYTYYPNGDEYHYAKYEFIKFGKDEKFEILRTSCEYQNEVAVFRYLELIKEGSYSLNDSIITLNVGQNTENAIYLRNEDGYFKVFYNEKYYSEILEMEMETESNRLKNLHTHKSDNY